MNQRTDSSRAKRRQRRQGPCQCCGQENVFCWTCRGCGLSICQACMLENIWGLSCNGITWQCPDCGESNGLGNQ